MLSDSVGEQIATWRKRRGLSRDGLAEACAARGMPELSSSVINNIETGRVKGRQSRRRMVTVDELAVLADALNVPPLILLVAYPDKEHVEILPGMSRPTYDVIEWFEGERNYGKVPTWGDATQALSSLRVHNSVVQSCRTVWHNLRMAFVNQKIEEQYPGDPDNKGPAFWEAKQRAGIAEFERVGGGVKRWRRDMREAGWPLPELPREVQHLDARLTDAEEGISDVGRSEIERVALGSEGRDLASVRTQWMLALKQEAEAYESYRRIADELESAKDDRVFRKLEPHREGPQTAWVLAAIEARKLGDELAILEKEAEV